MTSTRRTIVITGASDGIGAAAARTLSRRGHEVVVVGRSSQKTNAVADSIGAERFLADFAVLDDVRGLAAELRARYPRIDVLANNAGGIFDGPVPTVDGFERTFQVNHLAPFLLTRELMPSLVAGRASVIQTSSVGARLFGTLSPADLGHEHDFTPERAYGTAKLANILFTVELQRRFGQEGISAAAFHPGIVASSFSGESGGIFGRIYGSRLARLFMTTPDKGADQLVWLAEGTPGRDWEPGRYYEKRRIARRLNPQVNDAALARTLWERSAEMVGADA